MVQSDSNEINPYILDEETRYKVTKSHYVLGENTYRDLQNRHHERVQKLLDKASELGVSTLPSAPSADDFYKMRNVRTKYIENKDMYDSLISDALQLCTPEEIFEFLSKNQNPK